MEAVAEQTVTGLKVRIDRLLCVGFGDCIDVAPELWEFDDEGIVTFREPIPDIQRERLVTSCEVCPVDALSVHEDGKRIVP